MGAATVYKVSKSDWNKSEAVLCEESHIEVKNRIKGCFGSKVEIEIEVCHIDMEEP